MAPPELPLILIIDDDAQLGPVLVRLVEHTFAGFQVMWAKHGVVGLELVRRAADRLRFVVLDGNMPLLDGSLVAAQIRQLVPQVPVMPYTAHAELVPPLVALGCVAPVIKRPQHLAQLPEHLRIAMATPVPPVPTTALATALYQTGTAVMTFVQETQVGPLLAADQRILGCVQQALSLLAQYRRRMTSLPARELQQVQRVLKEALSSVR